MQANDLVTLMFDLPLLGISFWLTRRGSLRGQLLLTGTLGFFLYTYITMVFGAAYNKLFLVYVALFSLRLYDFILSMMSFDLKPCQLIARIACRAEQLQLCSSSLVPFYRRPGCAGQRG